jgi:hypothetical protein
MTGSCSMYVRDEKCIQNFTWETRREETRHRYVHNTKVYLKGIEYGGS